MLSCLLTRFSKDVAVQWEVDKLVLQDFKHWLLRGGHAGRCAVHSCSLRYKREGGACRQPWSQLPTI